MKKILIIAALLITKMANAGWDDSLRELRGSVGEIKNTSREVGRLGKEVGVANKEYSKATTVTSSEINSGDALIAKMNKVKVHKEANKESAKLLQLSKSDEVIYMGEVQNGMYKVTTPEGEGWVDKLLVTRPK